MSFSLKRSNPRNEGKIRTTLRFLSILFLIAALSPLACTPISIPAVPANNTATEALNTPVTEETASDSPLTFLAEADAQVDEDNPDTNAGDSTFLQVDGRADPAVESFIRFTVTGISTSIENAVLRMYATTNGSGNGPAVYATSTAWEESGITWNNRPSHAAAALDNHERINEESWVDYDVTAAVTGNGTFAFVLAADSSDAVTFSSRQGVQPPQLVITLAGNSTPTVVSAPPTDSVPSETATSGAPAPSGSILIGAEADARVRQSHPDENDGNSSSLHADGAGDSEIESFLRFTVTEVPSSFQSARLRVYVTDNGTDNGPAVYTTEDSWDESSITWNNRPSRTGDALDNRDHLGTNSWVEYDVTSAITGSGTFSFVLVADSSDGVVFSSREGSQPPQLALTSAGGNASARTSLSSRFIAR